MDRLKKALIMFCLVAVQLGVVKYLDRSVSGSIGFTSKVCSERLLAQYY